MKWTTTQANKKRLLSLNYAANATYVVTFLKTDRTRSSEKTYSLGTATTDYNKFYRLNQT